MSEPGPAVAQASFDGLLFDMDGTIIDSTEAVVQHWHTVGNEIGVDPLVILQTSHGRRSIDMLEVLSPEKANWEYVCAMEGRIPREYGSSAVEIPGARDLLNAVTDAAIPWAIVTSGTVPLVTGWIEALRLPRPPPPPGARDENDGLVTAESVARGKPDPEAYVLGRERLGFALDRGAAADLLVLEDSPAGIRAGKAAGCKVLGLITSHTLEQVLAAEPDWVVQDLECVRVVDVVVEDGRGRKVLLEFAGLLGGTAAEVTGLNAQRLSLNGVK